MRKRKIQKGIRISAYLLAGILGMLQPCTTLAAAPTDVTTETEQADESGTSDSESQDLQEVKYITAFEELSEEDSYFITTYKPSLEEALDAFPTTLLVQFEGDDTSSEIAVTWECADDFEQSTLASYLFYPVWEEEKYVIADSVKDSLEPPCIVIVLSTGMIADLSEAKSALQNILQEKSILALVYLCDKYEVKESADAESQTIIEAVSGQSVLITDVEMDEAGYVWYQVVLYQNGAEYKGYVESSYLATSDEELAEWKDKYVNLEAVPSVMEVSDGYPDIEQFPASYQNALYALKEAHPNWTFVRMDTGIDFNTAIAKELGDKNLVSDSCSASWKNGSYGQGWYYASEGILRYFMDPRNFLTDPAIFQFEQLTYNGSYHTTEAVQEILNKSFMSSTIPGENQTYAQAFAKIGKNLGISPFHLASRVLQEQGKGTSPLISGTYSGFEGYYNYFNVGASGTTDQAVIVSGLKKAVAQGWNTRYKSLQGGSQIIGTNYILKGQDTLYLEKFNVSNGGYANFTHQYMQNIQAPSSEATNVRKAYYSAGALENSFVFKIPVYNNMPASACSKPNATDSITLDKTSIGSLEVDKTAKIIPYVNGSKVDNVNNMSFVSSNTAVATVDNQGKITAIAPGTATISCSRSGASTASCTVTVVKATPSVTTPTLSPITYKEGLKLSDISLPDGWAWVNGNMSIATGTSAYAAIYTPADTQRYNTVTKDISFTVTKAIPNCQVPENLSIEVGSKLGSILLPSGFAWESDTETELEKAGEYTFYVSYNPDENNYYVVTHIPVIVKVTGKESGEDNTNTSSGSTSSGSTNNGNSNSGNTGGENTSGGNTSKPTTSAGSTSSGSTSSGSTNTGNGNTSSESTTNKPTTSVGSTSGGSTSSGSTNTGNSNTSSESSTNKPTTSAGSTSGGSTSSGSTNTGNSNTSSESSTNKPTTSAGSTSSGSTNTSSESTANKPTTSVGSTNSGSTSNGSTNTGNSNTSSESSTNKPTTSAGSTSNGSTNTGNSNTSSESSTNKPTTSVGSTNSGSTSNGSTNTGSTNTSSESSTNKPTTSAGSTTNESTNNGTTATTSAASTTDNATDNTNSVTAPTTVVTSGETNSQTEPDKVTGESNHTVNTNPSSADKKPVSNSAVTVESQTVFTSEDYKVEESTENSEQVTYVKPSVMMEMDDTTVLTTEKLQMAKEQNFVLQLNMGNQAIWNIDVGDADVNGLTDIDMGITFGSNDIPLELIDGIANGNEYVQFTLAHDGPFDFDAVLTVSLKQEDCGRYANLFYYNPETKELEFICASVIDANGQASFRMEHASSYVILVSDQSMEGLLKSDGENGIIKWIILGVFVFMLLVVAGYGIFYFWNKKQEEESDEEDEIEEADNDSITVPEVTEERPESDYQTQIISKEKKEKPKKSEPKTKEKEVSAELEKLDVNASAEDDWIEDEDWKEPEADTQSELEEESEEEPSLDSENTEDDWIDDDEWDVGNDWMDDDEWERKKDADKAKGER